MNFECKQEIKKRSEKQPSKIPKMVVFSKLASTHDVEDGPRVFSDPKAQRLYNDTYQNLVEHVNEGVMRNIGLIHERVTELRDQGIFSENEIKAVSEAFLLLNLTVNCFGATESGAYFLSAVTLETLLSRSLSRYENMSAHVNKCTIIFKEGGRAEHYAVRVVLHRHLPNRQAFICLDPGAHLYEMAGLLPDQTIHGGEDPEEAKRAFWIDELTEKSRAGKKRVSLMYNLWRDMCDRRRFFTMVGRCMEPADRLAMNLAMWNVIPEWNYAIADMRN